MIFSQLSSSLPLLGKGLVITLQITLTAIVVGMGWGTLLALACLSRLKWLSVLAYSYVTLFRSIPLVMVLLWFFLIVPQLLQALFSLPPSIDIRLISALVAFSLFEAAYYAEIIRAGIQSVPKGQVDAAAALGMAKMQTMTLVVLPQAFRVILPLLLTQALILFQDSALVYVIGLADFFRAALIVGERDGTTVQMVLLVGACYLLVGIALSGVIQHLREKRLSAQSTALKA